MIKKSNIQLPLKFPNNGGYNIVIYVTGQSAHSKEDVPGSNRYHWGGGWQQYRPSKVEWGCPVTDHPSIPYRLNLLSIYDD